MEYYVPTINHRGEFPSVLTLMIGVRTAISLKMGTENQHREVRKRRGFYF